MRTYRALIVCVLLCAGAHAAADSTWAIPFRYGAQVGVDSAASDGYDPFDQAMTSVKLANLAIFLESGLDGWDGPTGFYIHDIRAPLGPEPGSTKRWTVYLWADTTLPPSSTVLDLTCYLHLIPAPTWESVWFALTYVRAAVGTDDPWNEVGTSILLNDYFDAAGFRVPSYRTDNGLDGYVFELTATVIPEPSALIALGVGLAALGLRRRRSGTRRDMDVPRNSGGGHG